MTEPNDALETAALETAMKHNPAQAATGAAASAAYQKSDEPVGFFPVEPNSLEEAGLTTGEVESLILKYLLVCDSASGREIAKQIKLPFSLTKGVLLSLKAQLMVIYKSAAAMSDYEYVLDQAGRERARRDADRCTYCGTAPVSLQQYFHSTRLQSLQTIQPAFDDFFNAYQDLSVTPTLISQIGQAVCANRSLLLYGSSGNGKSSIAKRIILGIDQPIWIPRTLSIGGEIIRIYDASYHEELPLKTEGTLLAPGGIDRRWLRIKRPQVAVGAELSLEQLEFTRNEATGIIESSLQMKSNGGIFIIDDFGRQAVASAKLLNRLIVPMQNGYDYALLPSGRQLQVPFNQLLVFATNLDPSSLFDEALLHRIPYKIELFDPTDAQFRELFCSLAPQMGFEYCEQAVNQLIENHFKAKGRPLRYCLVGELLQQVKVFCKFHHRPLELTAEAFDRAVENYFAGL